MELGVIYQHYLKPVIHVVFKLHSERHSFTLNSNIYANLWNDDGPV